MHRVVVGVEAWPASRLPGSEDYIQVRAFQPKHALRIGDVRAEDRLDKARASFVSVKQSFNTTTSMGRLTLNVLLSFAQFEREVTGERIRDKIAASKAKGMWMGGLPPLGYDPPTNRATRTLVRNETEAEQVRRIFDLYLELGSVSALEARLAQGACAQRSGQRQRDTVGRRPVQPRRPVPHAARSRLPRRNRPR